MSGGIGAAGSRLLLAVVVIAVAGPVALAALGGMVVPLLVLAAVALVLRLIWFWTSL